MAFSDKSYEKLEILDNNSETEDYLPIQNDLAGADFEAGGQGQAAIEANTSGMEVHEETAGSAELDGNSSYHANIEKRFREIIVSQTPIDAECALRVSEKLVEAARTTGNRPQEKSGAKIYRKVLLHGAELEPVNAKLPNNDKEPGDTNGIHSGSEESDSGDHGRTGADAAGDGGRKGPPDITERDYPEDSPEDRGRRIELRDDAVENVMFNLHQALEDEGSDPAVVRQAQISLAETMAESVRSSSRYGNSAEAMNLFENYGAALNLMGQNHEARAILMYANDRLIDDKSRSEIAILLTIEKTRLLNKELVQGYEPTPADHPCLDEVIEQFERYMAVETDSEMLARQDQSIADFIELHGASKAAKWQSYIEHSGRKYEQLKNTNDIGSGESREELHNLLGRLFVKTAEVGGETVMSGEFSNRFIIQNTVRAMQLTDDTAFRQKLAENFLFVAESREGAEASDTNHIAGIVRELLRDFEVPASDAEAVIAAVKSNAPITSVSDAAPLTEYSRLLIRLNSLAFDRLDAAVTDDIDHAADIHAAELMKLQVRAHANEPVYEIIEYVENYNNPEAGGKSLPGPGILIDDKNLLMEWVEYYARTGIHDQAVDAICQMNEGFIEATVLALNIASNETDLNTYLWSHTDAIEEFHRTAEIVLSGDADMIYSRGEQLAAALCGKMSEISVEEHRFYEMLAAGWRQLNAMIKNLAEAKKPVAHELAVRVLEIADNYRVQFGLRYSNMQLSQIYETLIYPATEKIPDVADIAAVNHAIEFSADPPAEKAYYFAKLALQASK